MCDVNYSFYNIMGCGSDHTANNIIPQRKYNWVKGKILGKGTFGTVYEGLDNNTGKKVAIKNIQLTNSLTQNIQIIKDIKSEVRLHRKLKHPNIVQYITTDIPPDKNSIDIIIELVSGGSLLDRIKAFGAHDEPLIRIYAQQILEGLVYLHSNKIIHRDLKCANVLIDKKGVIKLTDFGTSVKLGRYNPTGIIGSPFWIAPEVLSNTGHSTLTDIWSFGCTIIELLTGHPPYYKENITLKEVFREIKKGPPNIPEKASFLLSDMLSKCLVCDNSNRLTAAALLCHPFIKGK